MVLTYRELLAEYLASQLGSPDYAEPGAVQCSAVQCSAVQCSAVQCSAVHSAAESRPKRWWGSNSNKYKDNK
jgi:hypothetical protein